MNELIEINLGAIELSKGVDNIIKQFNEAIEQLTNEYNELKKRLLSEMENKGVINVENGSIRINYIQPDCREMFDSKAFRAAYPDLYDEFVTMTPVKSSIRITVK